MTQGAYLGCTVLQEEGGLWRACGILAAAGSLRTALLMLRHAGAPDCAAAFVSACQEAGLPTKGPSDSGEFPSTAPPPRFPYHTQIGFHHPCSCILGIMRKAAWHTYEADSQQVLQR